MPTEVIYVDPNSSRHEILREVSITPSVLTQPMRHQQLRSHFPMLRRRAQPQAATIHRPDISFLKRERTP